MIKDKKYYGKYRGLVVNNSDPDQMARVKATIPDIFGRSEIGWIDPANGFLPGVVFIPPIGAKIWVEFEDGNINLPIYTACWHSNPSTSDIATEAKTNYPNNYVIKTPNGNIIQLNDGASSINIKTPLGSKIDIKDASQSIEIQNNTGNKITINSTGITITSLGLVNVSGTTINITASGVINLG